MAGPLEDLYKNKNEMPVYSYPKSLGNSRSGHYIAFSILQPTKSSYAKDPGAGAISSPTAIQSGIPTVSSVSNLNSVSSVASSAAAAASSASSIGTSITGAISGVSNAIGTVAGVATQAISTVTGIAGAAASVVGAVQGVSQIASSAANATNTLGQLSGGISAVTTGISAASSAVGAVGSAVGAASGIASTVGSILTTNPLDTASKAFDSIKSLFNSSDKPATPTSLNSTTTLTFTPSQMKPKGYINLYMPDTASMAQHASYGDVSVTEAMGKIGLPQSGLQNGGNIGALLGNL